MMRAQLESVLNGPITRVRHVYRFSTCRLNYRMTVAEHLYYCAFFAMWIWEYLRATCPRKFEGSTSGMGTVLGEILQRALLHDVEEALTGDTPRIFKYKFVEYRRIHHGATCRLMQDDLLPSLEGGFLGSQMSREWYRAWHAAKDDTLAGQVVQLADFFSVLSEITQEVQNGNKTILDHLGSIWEYYESLGNLREEFHPLVQEIGNYMDELLEDTRLARR